MNLQTKVMSALSEILTMYLDETDDKPWVVTWSGGKDSTTVLSLVAQAMTAVPKERRTRKVYAMMSDTRMENPELESYMHRQIKQVNEWAQKNEIPLEAKTASRPDDKGFFYLVIGKGYPLPNNNRNGRWCTHKLKLEPVNKMVAEIMPSLVFMGSRSEESARRAESIEMYREAKDSRFGVHQVPGVRSYMPIVHFTVEEVWEVLKRPLPWGHSEEVRTLYREATGECALRNPNGAVEFSKSCGARFGCWTCPPIQKDKSTENMSKIHEWMEPLTRWRKLLKDVYKDRTNKSGFKRDGKAMQPGQGALSISARQYLYDELIMTENEVNRLRAFEGLEPLQLLDDTEKRLIHEIWEEDSRERPWMLNRSDPAAIEVAATKKEEDKKEIEYIQTSLDL